MTKRTAYTEQLLEKPFEREASLSLSHVLERASSAGKGCRQTLQNGPAIDIDVLAPSTPPCLLEKFAWPWVLALQLAMSAVEQLPPSAGFFV